MFGCIKYPAVLRCLAYECTCVYERQGPLWCNTPKSLQCVLSDAKCAVLSLVQTRIKQICMYSGAFALMYAFFAGREVCVSDYEQPFKLAEGELQ